jgi:hypothetical protein
MASAEAILEWEEGMGKNWGESGGEMGCKAEIRLIFSCVPAVGVGWMAFQAAPTESCVACRLSLN